MFGVKRFAKCVERTCADIAVNNANAAEHEREKACTRRVGRMQIAAGLAGGD